METEFKFEVPSARLGGLERSLRLGKVVRRRLMARYFDTADGVLARHGVVLRLRKEGRRWMQTAKAPGDGVLERLEHNVDLGASRRGWEPAVDPRRHGGSAVGDLLDRLLGEHEAPLVEIFVTDIWRLTRLAREGDSLVELALDVGSVTARAGEFDDARVSRVCEFELELVEGEVGDLVALAARWSDAHRLWLSTISKSARGERLRAGMAHAPPVKAEPPVYPGRRRGKLSGEEIQQAVVSACLRQMLPNLSELAAASRAPEHVHQARVGIRRLRTALRELDALAFDRFDAAWEAPIEAVFLALGVQRDREVLQESIQPALRAAGGPLVNLPPEHEAAIDIGAAVRAPEFQAVLVSLIGFAAAAVPAPPGGQRAGTAIDRLRARLTALHRAVMRSGKRFGSMTAGERHRVRKKLKRLRYLCEFAAPLFDGEAAERYIAHLTPAQDALGRLNDEANALAAYRALAPSEGQAWFAVGWLGAQQAARIDEGQDALRALKDARPFWRRRSH